MIPPLWTLVTSKYSIGRTWGVYALRQLRISGSILDLGGHHNSHYHTCFASDNVTTVNLTNADIIHDLNKPLPTNVTDKTFDNVTAMWVLEHLKHPSAVIEEAFALLPKGGRLIATVPFLQYIHPSPKDYGRYAPDYYKDVIPEQASPTLQPIGTGVFSAVHTLLELALPRFLFPLRVVPLLLDRMLSSVPRWKRYMGPERYPIGFLVVYEK